MMSVGQSRLKNNTGFQVIRDTNTGKYYKIVEYDQPPTNRSNQFNLLDVEQHQGTNQNQEDQTFTTTEQNTPNQMIMQEKLTMWHNPEQNMQYRKYNRSVFNEHTCTSDENEKQRGNDNSQSKTNLTANKRARTLNDSDDFITVESSKSKKKLYKKNEEQINQESEVNVNTNFNINNRYNVPVEHIKRAIVHNLPCFHLKFHEITNLPSVVSVTDELYNHFNRLQIKLNNDFSVVRYVGNEIKIGVNNKDDYHTLNNQNVWPMKIHNQQISVILPKFVPEQFSLVVRYIPLEITVEQVAKEVKRSTGSAENFKKIVYHYQRSTNDFRFTVSDIKEYYGLLRLGHIGVGKKISIVSPYRPVNKLTYCTKCWALGHIRSQCKQFKQICKICLEKYDENHNNVCSKIMKCAQCQQKHHSLDASCHVVQEYRNNLNSAVKQAMEDGIITRTTNKKIKTTIPTTHIPNIDNNSFPQLTTTAMSRTLTRQAPWSNLPQNTHGHQQASDISNEKLFEKIATRLDENTQQINTRFGMVENEIKLNEKTISMFKQNLTAIVGVLKIVIQDIIYPIAKSISKTDKKTRETIDTVTSLIKSQMKILQIDLSMEDNQSNDEEDTISSHQQNPIITNSSS